MRQRLVAMADAARYQRNRIDRALACSSVPVRRADLLSHCISRSLSSAFCEALAMAVWVSSCLVSTGLLTDRLEDCLAPASDGGRDRSQRSEPGRWRRVQKRGMVDPQLFWLPSPTGASPRIVRLAGTVPVECFNQTAAPTLSCFSCFRRRWRWKSRRRRRRPSEERRGAVISPRRLTRSQPCAGRG